MKVSWPFNMDHFTLVHTAIVLMLVHGSLQDNAFSKIAKVNLQYEEYKDNREYWEVDMKIHNEYTKKRRAARAATSERDRLWPGGVVPYLLASSIKRRKEHLELLKGAMSEWEKKTCVRFKERTNQENFVEFYYGTGCNSDVGTIGTGRQTTSLGKGCEDHGIMVHELGHILGLHHEHNRPDRDDYVLINFSNIIPSYRYAFQKKNKQDIDSRKVPYDYYSVMHYGSHDFSMSKKPTIIAKAKGITHFGNDKVSNLDAKVVNLMYGCPELVKFPNDYQWKAYGLSKFNNPTDCIRVNEPKDPFSWDNNYLCRRPGKIPIGLKWSNSGPISGMTCIQAYAPSMNRMYSWHDNYWCWPKDSNYKFTWHTSPPQRSIRHQCIRINEPRDRLFSRRYYYLCGKKDESPVDGQWSAWSAWSRCSRQCGGGFNRRVRACNNPSPSYGGKYCPGENFMTGSCGTQSCDEWPKFPEDFTYEEYDLPPSDRICLRTFERYDLYHWTHNLFCTPDHLKDPLFEWSDAGPRPDMNCVRIYNPVEVKRIANSWNDNYLCSPRNTPYRFKFSRTGPIDNMGCLRWFPKKGRGWDNSYLCGYSDSSKARLLDNTLPIPGGWTEWTNWSACTKTCATGFQKRFRSCTNPSPKNGGAWCAGIDFNSRRCNVQGCVIDGKWSSWKPWTSCSKTCGGGEMQRRRTCSNPSPKNGGRPCYGPNVFRRKCNQNPCAINGGWSQWSWWGRCSKTCSRGVQVRSRTCSNPVPRDGGRMCFGPNGETRSCNNGPCSINGAWSRWSPWGACSKQCSGGVQLRKRYCSNPRPQYGGRECLGPGKEERRCNSQSCRRDGAWSSWADWQPCSATCGGGNQFRQRFCTNPAPRNGGRRCYGRNRGQRSCQTKPCPNRLNTDGGWSTWQAWQPCSRTCRRGVQKRLRTCTSPRPQPGGRTCPGVGSQARWCNNGPCSRSSSTIINGGWSSWLPWQPCSRSCNRGVQKRLRTCTNPRPQSGGKSCPGVGSQAKWCNNGPCPTDGQWSSWSKWPPCSKSCGGGVQSKQRTCTNPRPQNGGKGCIGEPNISRKCNTNRCNTRVDGRWSQWSSWIPCSTSCGDGKQQRMRKCDNPKPAYGGRNCYGLSAESRKCNAGSCPRDGKWSNWNSWKACSRSCNGGIQERTRSCSNPSPAYGGKSCIGKATETRSCNRQSCIVDGAWSSWSNWRSCTRTCGGGLTRRTRTCTNPKPAYGGRNCPGRAFEVKRCNTLPCRVDGKWSSWSIWRACTRSCGGGIQQRTRSCSNPRPANGGRQCSGYSYQTKSCNTQSCRIDGKWSPWSSWRSCNKRCGGGVQMRFRTCTNPSPSNGGRRCWGREREQQRCNTQPCRTDGKWSNWSYWGKCSASCNGGFSIRQRACNSPSPSNGGRKCTGFKFERRRCNTQACLVKWSTWGKWSACSVSCGGGSHKRMRRCMGRNCPGSYMQTRQCNTIKCKTGCGGSISGRSGRITSPRFPSYYPNGAQCTWIITVPDKLVVKLKFNSFYLENGVKCPNDYVEVRDGNSQGSLILGKFCGGSRPETQLSSGSTMWVRFHANRYYNYRGFEAVWSTSQQSTVTSAASKVKGNGRSYCGGHIYGNYGRLSSPGYPQPYKPNQDCAWVITVSKGRIIQFYFKDVDIDGGGGYCSHDYLTLRDGSHRFSPFLGRYCANRKPRRLYSKTSSNSLRIRLKSDNSLQGRGFSMWWTSYHKYKASKQQKPNSQAKCPPYWLPLVQESLLSCYTLSKDYQTWNNAHNKCKHLGAQLASVNSKTEQEFITNKLLKVNYALGWVGLRDFNQTGKWTWLDKSSVKYANWASGEPNNGGSKQNEYCALIKFNGKWNDYPCDTKHKYVCKTTKKRGQ